jgi:thiosulfate dehydrogenase (quinone) large subunit
MSADNNDTKCCQGLSLAYANLLLRLWIGLRLFMAGLDKFREGNGFGNAPGNVTFNWTNYLTKTDRIAKLMAENSFLPSPMCYAYAKSIGFILITVAVWVTVGICTELGLLAAGFTVLSLGLGLAALPDDTEVVYIGIHVLIIAAALATSKANKISLDGMCRRGKCD